MRWARAPVKLPVDLRPGSHLVSTCHEYAPFDFFHYFKSYKKPLSSLIQQNQGAGQVRPVPCYTGRAIPGPWGRPQRHTSGVAGTDGADRTRGPAQEPDSADGRRHRVTALGREGHRPLQVPRPLAATESPGNRGFRKRRRGRHTLVFRRRRQTRASRPGLPASGADAVPHPGRASSAGRAARSELGTQPSHGGAASDGRSRAAGRSAGEDTPTGLGGRFFRLLPGVPGPGTRSPAAWRPPPPRRAQGGKRRAGTGAKAEAALPSTGRTRAAEETARTATTGRPRAPGDRDAEVSRELAARRRSGRETSRGSSPKQRGRVEGPRLRPRLPRRWARIAPARAAAGGMGLSRVRAVFFDLDNTLIDTAGASRKGMLEVIKLLQSKYQYKEEAEIICDKVQVKLSKECFHPSNMCITDLRTSHWEEAIQETKGGAANRKLAEECYFLWKSTRLQHMTLAEDVKAMLTELRKEVRLLLLTNGERQTQREKIEACACQSYFDAIVVGGEQEEEKPAPSIFYYSCDLLGVQPGDCVMVGDTLETDIQGGLNAGLKATVWINRNGTVPLKSSPMPHYIVSSVLELPALLQSIDCRVSVSA